MSTNLIVIILFSIALSYDCRGQNKLNGATQKDTFLSPAMADNVRDCMSAKDFKFYEKMPDSVRRKLFLHPSSVDYHRLTEQELLLFTLKEKIAFAIYYPESYAQVCSNSDLFSSKTDYVETDYQKFLHPFLSRSDNARIRSQRQIQILDDNRDCIIIYLASCLHTTNYIGEYEKEVIIRLNGYECIPGLLDIYAKNSDTDILTICINLMENDKFSPLYESDVYNELSTVATDSYWGDNYRTWRKIPLTQQVVTSVITLARQYYAWKIEHK